MCRLFSVSFHSLYVENNLQKDQIYVREFWHVDRWNDEEIVHLIYSFASSEKLWLVCQKKDRLTSAENGKKH